MYSSCGRHTYASTVSSTSCVVDGWIAYTSSLALLWIEKNSLPAAREYTRRRSTIRSLQPFTSSANVPVYDCPPNDEVTVNVVDAVIAVGVPDTTQACASSVKPAGSAGLIEQSMKSVTYGRMRTVS